MDKNKKMVSLCYEFIEENGIDVGQDAIKKCVYTRLLKEEPITGEDLGLDSIDLYIAKVESENEYDKAKEKLEEPIDELIMLLLTSQAMYSRKLEKEIRKRKQDNSHVKVLMIGNSKLVRYSVCIESRVRALYDDIVVPQTRKYSEKVSGGVYSASLYDIVKMYNEIGDELFKKNVRLRVNKDNVGVGVEIKKTLRNNPEQFWFLNNGITIVADSSIDKSNNTSICLERNENCSFSVVNGAQTIAAAHDFFYCDDEDEKDIELAKKAMVLLRVVSVENQEVEELNDVDCCKNEPMSECISKSLNRQKPIEQEDLAYYSAFAKGVNRMYEEVAAVDSSDKDNRFFGIARRGELEGVNDSSYEHSLPLIARAIRASGYKEDNKWKYVPWKSVNTYNADILKMNGNDLQHTDLFESKRTEKIDDFLETYQYVNLAIFLYRYYAKAKNQVNYSHLKNQGTIEIIKERGTWYFVSFFFEFLLENSGNEKLQPRCIMDFGDYISENDFKRIIEKFFAFVDELGILQERDLRKEETYSKLQTIIRRKNGIKALQEIAKRLYITFEEGDILSYDGIDATVQVKGNHFLLRKGSSISKNVDSYCSQMIKDMREEYSEHIDGDKIIKDIEFDDLSTAAKFVEGRRLVKGYRNWNK